jgi:hypothetical protein
MIGRVGVVAAAVVLAMASGGCVGSGKVARASEIEPLPDGLRIVTDVSEGCRDGESGFDYRFVVVTGTNDLSTNGRLLSALRAQGFYHSIGLADDLPWITVGYQRSDYPLRAEMGPLAGYLDRPRAHQGPDPSAIPAEVRDHPGESVLVALRPTDFACTTPL